MLKSIMMPALAAALAVTAWLLVPLRGDEAAAQSAPLYINTVDFDIAVRDFDTFMDALKSDGAASMKEPGVREFDIAVSPDHPSQVFVFEVFDNAAVWDAHLKSSHYSQFISTTMTMVKKYDIKPFSSVAMNSNGLTASGPFFINVLEFDVVPSSIDQFMDAAKENAAASVKDPGCHEFNIAVSQKDPNHVLFFEVFYNAAGFAAHQTTDHFKKYQAATAKMISKPETKQLTAVATNVKGGP